MLQINEIKSWISNYEVLFSNIVSEYSFSKDGIMKLSKKNSMTEILMVYLNLYYWFMAKIWKNVSKFM